MASANLKIKTILTSQEFFSKDRKLLAWNLKVLTPNCIPASSVLFQRKWHDTVLLLCLLVTFLHAHALRWVSVHLQIQATVTETPNGIRPKTEIVIWQSVQCLKYVTAVQQFSLRYSPQQLNSPPSSAAPRLRCGIHVQSLTEPPSLHHGPWHPRSERSDGRYKSCRQVESLNCLTKRFMAEEKGFISERKRGCTALHRRWLRPLLKPPPALRWHPTSGRGPSLPRASRRPPAAARPRHRHNPQARVRRWDSHLQQGPCRSSPLPRPARCRSFRRRRRRVQGHHGEEQSPEGSGAPRQQLDGLCRVPLVPSPGTARKRGKSSGWTPSSELCSDEPGDHRIKVDMVRQADVHLEQPPYLLCSLAEEGGTMARQAEGGEEPCKGRRTSPLQAQEEPSAQSAPWAFNEQVLAELFDSSLHIISESDCSYDSTERGSEDNFSSSRSEGSISVPGVHASASGSTRSSFSCNRHPSRESAHTFRAVSQRHGDTAAATSASACVQEAGSRARKRGAGNCSCAAPVWPKAPTSAALT
ncbi:uncharacterized protein LOC141918774 [Strix aluco]|uniref:uncharacterized protein LOC141918774 n=1 Tax=Strix aluco TaxID=111821 RepID=UPI003DA1EAE6